jgi:hypothetical protein
MPDSEGPKTILLVDQNDEDVDLFRRAADRSCEADVRRLRSGKEALGYLSGGQDSLPQLIIVELDLPSADAFASAVRQRRSKTQGDPCYHSHRSLRRATNPCRPHDGCGIGLSQTRGNR